MRRRTALQRLQIVQAVVVVLALAWLVSLPRLLFQRATAAAMADDHLPTSLAALRAYATTDDDALERRLFSWTDASCGPKCQRARWTGRGIALTCGDMQVPMLLPLLITLRSQLGCALPIVVFYLGNDDLSPASRALLVAHVRNLTVVDLHSLYAADALGNVNGYCAKNFALYASPFRETIMFDSDSLFFQSPDALLDDVEFKNTGSIFFHDLITQPWDKTYGESVIAWLHALAPDISADSVARSRVLSGIDAESDVDTSFLAYDKQRRFFSMMAAVKLCEPDVFRVFTTVRFLGDKETHWLGALLVGEPFPHIVPGDAHLIGRARPFDMFCGSQLHLDRGGRPFHANSSPFLDKFHPRIGYVNASVYATVRPGVSKYKGFQTQRSGADLTGALLDTSLLKAHCYTGVSLSPMDGGGVLQAQISAMEALKQVTPAALWQQESARKSSPRVWTNTRTRTRLNWAEVDELAAWRRRKAAAQLYNRR